MGLHRCSFFDYTAPGPSWQRLSDMVGASDWLCVTRESLYRAGRQSSMPWLPRRLLARNDTLDVARFLIVALSAAMQWDAPGFPLLTDRSSQR